jgi:hypothetical protein
VDDLDFFDEAPPVAASERLTLDIDGWEGPLDLLLTLARSQKVDLARSRSLPWSSNISPSSMTRRS